MERPPSCSRASCSVLLSCPRLTGGEGAYLQRLGPRDVLWRGRGRRRRRRWGHRGDSGGSGRGWVLLQPGDADGRGGRAQEGQCDVGASWRKTDEEGPARGASCWWQTLAQATERSSSSSSFHAA